MSLKIFHGIFILLSTLFTAGFAVYCFLSGTETLGDAAKQWGLFSGALTVVLVVYGIYFIGKARRLP